MFRKTLLQRARCIFAACAIAACIMGPGSRAKAASILTWTLQSVTFASGEIATGSFSVDPALGTLTDWDVRITGGSRPALTNIILRPGGACVVFCGRLFTGTPAPAGLDLRTPLASDQTFFEMPLYFDAPLTSLLHPAATPIAVNAASSIQHAELLNPTTVRILETDNLSSAAINPRLTLVPEPASFFLLLSVVAGLSVRRCVEPLIQTKNKRI